MEKIIGEVRNLEKAILYNGILFLDKELLKRILELKKYFKKEIISHVENRLKDNRTNEEIMAIIEIEMAI